MPEEVVSNFIHDIIDKELAEGYNTEVHTRFPPEPNGYLHIGSAKAIWINASTAEKYGGKFNLRYDDTNPAREDDEYLGIRMVQGCLPLYRSLPKLSC